jgi:hypothetical protein
MSASLPTQIKACFNAVGTSQFSFDKKEGYPISWEGYAHHVLGFSGVLLAHFWKCDENVKFC